MILKQAGKIQGLGALASLFDVTVNPAVGTSSVSAAFQELKTAGDDNVEALLEAWGRVLDVVNVDLYEEWEKDTRVALDSVKNRLKCTPLDAHGPRLGPITNERVFTFLLGF